ncbi:MAG: chromosomal replication initiator protein DnaA [Gemmataceae bacterium]
MKAVLSGTAAMERALAERIGLPRYQLWFQGHTRLHFDKHTVTIGVPNLHFQDWLQKTFGKTVEATAREIFGKNTTIKFKIDPELFRSSRAAQEEVKQQTAPKSGKQAKKPIELPDPPKSAALGTKKRGKGRPTPSMFPPPLSAPAKPGAKPAVSYIAAEEEKKSPTKPRPGSRRWHDFKDFVVGASNRVAFAAAQSVVEDPGQGANPLVIHGSVGTGKTHLLEGIYAGIRRKFPGLSVRYATAEDFTNRFVQAMRNGKLSNFRKLYRDCDVLLIDDLHFLAKKKATQEEFLHTFDTLLADGKQLVLTTDCHPRLADDLSPELSDRLLGGAVWGLQPPDSHTRLELLKAKSAGHGPTISEDVLKHIASKLRGNVRELEGAVRNLRHLAKVLERPVDFALAKEALGDLLRHAVRVVQPTDIDAAVCQVLRLAGGSLQSKSRSWSVSHPRMLAIYLARKHTAASYGEIGKHFGGRNHSTAVAAEKKVRQWLASDATLTGSGKPWRVREIIELAERVLGL